MKATKARQLIKAGLIKLILGDRKVILEILGESEDYKVLPMNIDLPARVRMIVSEFYLENKIEITNAPSELERMTETIKAQVRLKNGVLFVFDPDGGDIKELVEHIMDDLKNEDFGFRFWFNPEFNVIQPA